MDWLWRLVAMLLGGAVLGLACSGCAHQPRATENEPKPFRLPVGSVYTAPLLIGDTMFSVFVTPSGDVVIAGPGPDQWTMLPRRDPDAQIEESVSTGGSGMARLANEAHGRAKTQSGNSRATVAWDMERNWARLTLLLPNQEAVLADPATSPFPIEYAWMNNPDGTRTVEYEGRINDICGVLMHQGIRRLAIDHALLGHVDLKFDPKTSTVRAMVNGKPAPKPYDITVITIPDQ